VARRSVKGIEEGDSKPRRSAIHRYVTRPVGSVKPVKSSSAEKTIPARATDEGVGSVPAFEEVIPTPAKQAVGGRIASQNISPAAALDALHRGADLRRSFLWRRTPGPGVRTGRRVTSVDRRPTERGLHTQMAAGASK